MFRSVIQVAGLVLAVFCDPAFSQQSFSKLSMQKATELALEHHPEVKNARIDVEIIKNQRSAWPDFSPTRFSYYNGQLTTPVNDHLWMINQDFGSPLTPIYARKKNLAEQTLSKTILQLTEKDIIAKTKILYNSWIYFHHKLNLISSEKTFYSDLNRIAGVQYELGETTLLEKTKTETDFARLTAQHQQIQNQLVVAEQQLRQYIMVEDDLIPENEELLLYEIQKPAKPTDSLNLHIRYVKQQAEIRQASVNVEKSRLFPEVHAGYFNQNINGQAGFDGWQAGFSIPLWFFPQRQKIREAKLETSKALNQLEYRKYSLEKETELLRTELNSLFSQIQFYKSHLLEQSDLLVNTATSNYKNENIGYIEYLQNISKAFEIQREYLDILKSYNEIAIKLEYYAY